MIVEVCRYRIKPGCRAEFIQWRTLLLLCSLVVILQPLHGFARKKSSASGTSLQQTPTQRDGQHDFDFEIGT